MQLSKDGPLLLGEYHRGLDKFLGNLKYKSSLEPQCEVWKPDKRNSRPESPVTGTTIPWKGKKGQKGISVYFHRMQENKRLHEIKPAPDGSRWVFWNQRPGAWWPCFSPSPPFASQDDNFICSWTQAVHSITILLHLRTSNSSSNLSQNTKAQVSFTSCSAHFPWAHSEPGEVNSSRPHSTLFIW